ncbi:MAG: ankyrin repeat domain-containing protein [Elusimicrobia bacterium]|nr:ankyrin repeat domain-containing protein [Elusimicrobiota bacterium]
MPVLLSLLACGCASPVLYRPAENGDIPKIKALLDGGADPNARWSYNTDTPLLAAVSRSRLEAARLLIERGADVNLTRGGDKAAPLHYAACVGNAGMVQLLLEKGADPDPGSATCFFLSLFMTGTPLELAEKNGHQLAASLIRNAIASRAGPASAALKNAGEYGPLIVSLLRSYTGGANTIAVAGFSYADGHESSDGKIVAERFTTELIKRRQLKVVERKEIEKVLSELKLQNAGTIDPESAKNIGHMLGADLLVIGGIVELPGRVLELNIRLASVESGEAVAAVSGRVMKDWIN